MAYKDGNMISFTDLMNNGWTKRLIETQFGEPDYVKDNPYSSTGFPQMRLYNRKRVEIAEQTALFKNHCKRSHFSTEGADLSDFFA